MLFAVHIKHKYEGGLLEILFFFDRNLSAEWRGKAGGPGGRQGKVWSLSNPPPPHPPVFPNLRPVVIITNFNNSIEYSPALSFDSSE